MAPFHGDTLATRYDGRAICTSCALALNVEVHGPPMADGLDPVLAEGWLSAIVYVTVRAHQTLSRPYSGSIGPAIRFGYVMTLAGIAMWLGWVLLLHPEPFLAMIIEAMETSQRELPEGDPEQAALIGAWLMVPLFAAVRLTFGGLAIHLGARLAGAPKGTFHDHLRLFSLASASLVFCILPEFGPFVAMIIWLSTTLAFLRQRYGFGLMRSLASTLPAMLVMSGTWPAWSTWG